MFRSFFFAGFECATGYNASGDWIDQISATHHDKHVDEDYRRLQEVGIWDAAAQGGNNLVANGALTGLTATTKYLELTLTATANNTVLISNTLYVNVGTALANATIELDIYGDVTVGRE